MMRNTWHYSLITASILAGLSAAQAAETTGTVTSRTETDNTVHLKKVHVSASRPQVRQQTTLSTRVDGKTLEQDRLYRFEDIAQEVSGVDIAETDALDTRITIRGIGDGGGSEINIGMPSSVGQFLDGVRLSRPGMLSNDLLDIDSINVLKGPQGTLYGFNTSAGAIDIRSRKPTFTPESSLEQSVGQRGYVQSKLMASGALTDTLAGRINLSHTEKGGYVDNVLNGNTLGGSRSDGVRGQLLWQPTDNLDVRFIGDYSDATSFPVMSLVDTHAVNGKDTFLTRAKQVGATVIKGRDVALDDESKTHVTQGGTALSADLRLNSGYTLHSLSSWRYFRYLPQTADGLSIPLYANSGADTHDRIWEQRFWFDSPKGGIVDYTVGVDYWGENLDTFAHDHYYSGSTVTTWYGNTSNTGKYVQRFGELNDDAVSLYANSTWHLDEQLDLITGLRGTWEKKTGSFRRINKSDFDSGKLSQTNHLPAATASLNWYATPNITPYLTLAYAEKSGGLNVSSGAASKAGLDSLYIDPEKTRSVELGVKTHWLQRKVEWNTALFWSEVRDFQTTAYDEETLSSYLINAGKYRSRGIESQLAVYPTEGLSLALNGTLLDASYLDFENAKCPAEISLQPNAPATCDLSGKRVFSSPRLSWNARARYEWNTINNLQAFVSGQYSWRSWAYGTVDDSDYTRIPAYGVLNLSTGLSGKQDNHTWRVSLWLQNALNKSYYRVIKAGDYGSAYGQLADERLFGVTVGWDFKG